MQGDVESGAAARAVVVARLRARRDELVQAIFERVSGDAFAPPGGSVSAGTHDAEYVAGLRAAVRAAVEYVLTGVEHGEAWVGQVPAVALEQARRAARIGVSVDTVLRRYVVGHTLLGDLMMEEADRGERDGEIPPAQRGAVRAALRTQAAGVERLLQEIAAAHADELQRAGRSSEQRRSERVQRLLAGGTVAGSELDYDLEGWHLGAIVVGSGALEAVRELAASVDRRLLSVEHEPERVWVWLGGRERWDLERAIMRAAPAADGVMFALGEPARGIEGWRLTHRQAQAALVVAVRRGGRESIPFTRYADVALLATALKDELLAAALIDTYIAPLEDPRGGDPVLCETLRAYLAAERSVSSTAAALGVVRKTVENRLRAIEEKLGRTLHPCPVELEVALRLDELTPAPAPPEISIIGETEIVA
jgi:hypothetical protein